MHAEDYYVCATNGKGKKATREKPAKDLGNIVSKLLPGDTVRIAGGVYRGRGECGCCVINDQNTRSVLLNPLCRDRDLDFLCHVSITVFDRNAAEADIKAQESSINEVRSMLGLPVQAGVVDGPAVEVWLNRISVENAINVGSSQYLKTYGCEMPATE